MFAYQQQLSRWLVQILKSGMNFYKLSGGYLLILIIACIYKYRDYFLSEKQDYSNFLCSTIHSDEFIWRIVCTSIACPLLIEYGLDLLVTFVYPTINETHVLEDRLGHGILIASLIPLSYVPYWIFGNSFCLIRDGLVSISHTMVVCGVLGKLETFSKDIWHESDAIAVLTIFVIAQLCLVLGMQVEHGLVTYQRWSLIITCILKFISVAIFFRSSQNIPLVFQEITKEESNFFITRKYLCSILFIGLSFFLMICSLLTCQACYRLDMEPIMDMETIRIVVQLVTIIVTAVLPGRIIRRGLQAVEKTIAMKVY
jgi:hypothetical protein